MLRLLLLLLALFIIAFGFHWLKDTSGEVSLTLGDTAYAVDITTAAVALLVALALAVLATFFVRALFQAPRWISRGWRRQNQERGRLAVTQGLIAVAAGDLRSAERAALEASRRLPELPLTRLLVAQTAQLKGDRAAARQTIQAMTADPQTRIAGLRGLYIEAEREGERDAAWQIAERAREESPATPWALRAVLRHQTAVHDWDGALQTLVGAANQRILDKRTARRQRAVILTALALDREDGEPDRARQAALEAHDLAPDLVPAAVVAGRLLARQGDIRRATRILENAWRAGPHPELADAYLHVRAGDSAIDRLKRAETLYRLRAAADEGRLAVARAAIDARDFSRARDVLAPVLTERPTQRALMIMAELVEAETGDSGRAREWQARAVRAPRDPAWTTDGVVLEAWAPASPVTGRLDTVEWKVPVAELEAPGLEIKPAELRAPAITARPATQAEAKSAAPEITSSEAFTRNETTAPPIGADSAPPKRTNGGGRRSADKDIETPPPHGAIASDASREASEIDPAHPPLPDDPGVPDDNVEEENRRFRLV